MAEPRISIDHLVMGGVPVVRGTRVPVSMIVGLLAEGRTLEAVLADYPQLERGDILAALEFAARAVSERQLPLRGAA